MKIKIFCLSALLIFAASCTSIEKRDTLQNSYDPANITLEASQSTPGGNEITLKMTSPGVSGYWNYNLDVSLQNEITFVYPIPGKATFTYVVGTPYINGGDMNNLTYATKTIDVQVDKLDHPVAEAYYLLVGDDLQSKTWKFDGGPAPDGRQWWYMCNGNNAGEVWWNAAGDCCPPSDAAATITFNLLGGANAVYDNMGTKKSGSFAFNGDFSTITMSGTDIPGAEGNDGTGVYYIYSLTADKLILTVPNNIANGTGWAWVFVPVAE